MVAGVGADLGVLRQMAEPQRTLEAARQFESLLLEHLVRTMRESLDSGSEQEDSGGSETYLEMAEQQLARALAERGGLGIARLVLASVHKPGKAADMTMEAKR
jgi:Rod binding domain-containing protein